MTHVTYIDQIDADKAAAAFLRQAYDALPSPDKAHFGRHNHEGDGRTTVLWVDGKPAALAVVVRDDLNRSVLVTHNLQSTAGAQRPQASPVSQSRMQSAVEVVTNTATGFVGSWLIAFAVLTAISDRALASTVTVLGCTVWSLARGWTIRRVFNRRLQTAATTPETVPSAPHSGAVP